MTKAGLLWKVLVALVLWPFLMVLLGLLVSFDSPQGKVAFFLASLVLGALGAVCQVAYNVADWLLQRPARRLAVSGGAACGLAAWPLTFLVFDHRLMLPQDLYQFALLAYLVAAGAGIAWLLRLRLRGSPGGSEEDVHPYISVGIGDHVDGTGGDS
jgi:hypothetical protein